MFTMPAGAHYAAMVEYLDIRLRKILGHASTRIAALFKERNKIQPNRALSD